MTTPKDLARIREQIQDLEQSYTEYKKEGKENTVSAQIIKENKDNLQKHFDQLNKNYRHESGLEFKYRQMGPIQLEKERERLLNLKRFVSTDEIEEIETQIKIINNIYLE